MIWHEGAPGRVVCVGYGDVGEQLASERLDPSVLACEMFGPLRVTWASVMPSERAGVARYLADYWTPLLGDGGVTASAVEANPPFAG